MWTFMNNKINEGCMQDSAMLFIRDVNWCLFITFPQVTLICDSNAEYTANRDWISGSCATVDERVPLYVTA